MEIKTVPGHAIGDVALAADIGRKLNDNYPGWGWDVFIDDEPTGGILRVISQVFEMYSPLRSAWGLTIPITTAYADPDRKRILRHAGRMLEFCGLPHRYTGGDLDLTEFARNYQTYFSKMNYGFGSRD